jgi:hypothetical protein
LIFLEKFDFFLRSVLEIWGNGQTRLQVWCSCTPNKFFRPLTPTQTEFWKTDFWLRIFFGFLT